MDGFDVMRLFVRLCETRSFSIAAREAGVQQPAASKRVQALERELGVKLFDRNTRGVRPTDAGGVYYEHCKRWLGEMEDVQERLVSARRGVRGALKLSVPVSIGQIHLTRIALAFQKQHPGVQVHLHLTDRRVDLVKEGVDVAIRIGAVGDLDVVARKLAHYEPVLVAAPSYLSRHGAPASLEELEEHRLLYYGIRDEFVLLHGRSYLARRDADLVLNDPLAVREAVRDGLAIGLVNPWLAQSDLERGVLVRIMPEASGERFDVHAVTLPGRSVPARIRAFVAHCALQVPRIPGMNVEASSK
jgi:DNA-binding transcriptional LysR family regulator